MDMLPSLCAAMVRANGDSLVLESGCAPYVLSDAGRVDVAKATLSDNALDALVGQIFSDAGRDAFRALGKTSERVDVPSAGLQLTAAAERRDSGIVITLSRTPVYDLATPEPAVDESLFAAPEHPLATPNDLTGWEETPGLFAGDEPVPEPADWSAAPAAAPVDVSDDAEDRWAETELEAPVDLTPEPQAPDDMFAYEPTDTLEIEPSYPPPVPLAPAPASLRIVEPSVPTVTLAQPDTDLMAWAADAADKGATTVYLRTGALPVARVEERVEPIGPTALDQETIEQLVGDLEGSGDPEWQHSGDGEWTRVHPTMGRITCRVFSDDQGRGIILRLQPQAAARGLIRLVPRQVRAACDGEGLVVVSAPKAEEALAFAGAVADIAGKRRGGFVIALRPVGAQRPQLSGAFVSQREFAPQEAAAAIRAAVAEGPDTLLLTQVPGDAVAREVARAADGSRLIVLAVAAPTSLQAVRGLFGRGSTVADTQLRLMLAGQFRAAFATRTLRRLGGGRVVVQDLLLGTGDVANVLASGDYAGLMKLQRQGVSGMFTVDERLARAVRRGHLTLRQGVEVALDRRHLVSLIRTARRAARLTARAQESEAQPAGHARWSVR